MNFFSNFLKSWRSILLYIFLAIFVLVPILSLILTALSGNPGILVAPLEGGKVSFTLRYFKVVLENSYFLKSLGDSILMAITVTILTLVFSFPISYGFSRTNMKGKKILRSLLMMGLAIPSFIITYDIIIFTSEIDRNFANIYSMPGLIAVMTIAFIPFMVMYLTLAFDSVDDRLIEAAKANGAPTWYITLRITLPLLMQGVYSGLILVFLLTLGSLSVPLLLAPINFPIVTSLAYTQLLSYNNFGTASALLILLFMISLAAIILYIYFSRNTYATIGGKGFRHNINQNKPMAWLLTLYSLIFASLPIIEIMLLILTAFSYHWAGTVLPLQYTLSNFSTAFALYPTAIYSTIILVTVSTIVAVVTSFVTIYGLRIGLLVGKRFINFLILIIFSLSNVVIGLSYLTLFSNRYTAILINQIPFAVIMGYTFARIGYSFRSVGDNFNSISNGLIEAGRLMSASRFNYFKDLMIPLALPGITEGFLIMFVRSSIDYGSTIFLAPYGWTTLSLASFSLIYTGEFAYGAAMALIILIITIPITVYVYVIRGRSLLSMK